MCMQYGSMHMCHGACMKVKGRLAGICFLCATTWVLGIRSGSADLAHALAAELSC